MWRETAGAAFHGQSKHWKGATHHVAEATPLFASELRLLILYVLSSITDPTSANRHSADVRNQKHPSRTQKPDEMYVIRS